MSHRVQSSVVLTACLLLLCSSLSTAAVLNAIADTNPDHPNSCWLQDVGKAIPVGGSLISETQCAEYQCDTYTEGQLLLATYTCGVTAVPPGCVSQPADHSKPYPGCCGGDFVCKNITDPTGNLSAVFIP